MPAYIKYCPNDHYRPVVRQYGEMVVESAWRASGVSPMTARVLVVASPHHAWGCPVTALQP